MNEDPLTRYRLDLQARGFVHDPAQEQAVQQRVVAEPLLRLRSAEDVMARLTFHNTGPGQVPGVIVMQLRDDLPDLPRLSPATDRLLVVFNAGPSRVSINVPEAAGRAWLVHAVQTGGVDAGTLKGAFVSTANGNVSVPPFSTVVFVAPNLERLGALRFEQALSPTPRFAHRVFMAGPEEPSSTLLLEAPTGLPGFAVPEGMPGFGVPEGMPGFDGELRQREPWPR